MHVILHIGTSKTGTTALQATFASHSKALRQHGILYPLVESHITHQFLSLALCEPARLARNIRNIYQRKPWLIEKDFQRDWRMVRNQIDKYRPHTLVLSSEQLFLVPDAERAEVFRRLLHQLSDDIQIVAYVRQPSARYLSSIQQTLKASGNFVAPRAVQFRKPIEFYEGLFPGKVRIAAFVRDHMYRGDIVSDFVHRHLSSEVEQVLGTERRDVNESISAEAMSILQDYRRTNHPDIDNLPTWDSAVLLQKLRHAERRYGLYRRPQLKKDIADYIDRVSVDQLWLREKHGIVFPGVDYNAIGQIGVNPYQTCSRVEDVCVMDEAVKRKILMYVGSTGKASRLKVSPMVFHWFKRHAGNPFFRTVKGLMRRMEMW